MPYLTHTGFGSFYYAYISRNVTSLDRFLIVRTSQKNFPCSSPIYISLITKCLWQTHFKGASSWFLKPLHKYCPHIRTTFTFSQFVNKNLPFQTSQQFTLWFLALVGGNVQHIVCSKVISSKQWVLSYKVSSVAILILGKIGFNCYIQLNSKGCCAEWPSEIDSRD